MDFTVFCDESRPEALMSTSPTQRYLCIGSVWLPRLDVLDAKSEIANLKNQYQKNGEIKWGKVSPSSVDFYCALVDLFFDFGQQLSFRVIVVDNQKVDMSYHDDNHELGFYKFYYQLLKHKLRENSRYRIYCDLKSNQALGRAATLKEYLDRNTPGEIEMVQMLPSKELVLMQLSDLLLGAVSAKFNFGVPQSEAKRTVISRIEERLGHVIAPTSKNENKFNVFKIEPGFQG